MSGPAVPPVPATFAVPPVARPSRPAGVFAATYLLSGASAIWLSAAVATLFSLPEHSRYHGDRAQDAEAAARAAFILVSAVQVVVLAAGVALLLAVMSAYGGRAARVLTWTFAAMAGSIAGSIPFIDDLLTVAWHRWSMLGVCAITLIILAATCVLLALPSSNAYIRAVGEAHAARRAARRGIRQALSFPRPYQPPALIGAPPPAIPPQPTRANQAANQHQHTDHPIARNDLPPAADGRPADSRSEEA